MDADSLSQSTTEPNTPDAGPIEDETMPSGDLLDLLTFQWQSG